MIKHDNTRNTNKCVERRNLSSQAVAKENRREKAPELLHRARSAANSPLLRAYWALADAVRVTGCRWEKWSQNARRGWRSRSHLPLHRGLLVREQRCFRWEGCDMPPPAPHSDTAGGFSTLRRRISVLRLPQWRHGLDRRCSVA